MEIPAILAVACGSGLFNLWIGIPLAERLARRLNALDMPGDLKVHSRPIPRLGGVGIAFSIAASCAWLPFARGGHPGGLPEFAMVCGWIAFTILGVVDDVRGLPQTLKFGVEAVVAAAVALTAGPADSGLRLAFAAGLLVSLPNAYNFVDGLDGLAGGLAAVNFGVLGTLLAVSGSGAGAAVAFAAMAAVLAFLRHNWEPARVFMGDGGSLGLGWLAASLSLHYLRGTEWRPGSVAAVLLAAGIPVVDIVLTLVRRLVTRRSLRPRILFAGDRFHFYDQMRARGGLSTRHTVTIAMVAQGVLGALAIAVSDRSWPLAATTTGGALLALVFAGRCLGIRAFGLREPA
jgi:UDP-GlcNAc:undecaprenyl-phosphate GlcNAc-1-phosphate transferase